VFSGKPLLNFGDQVLAGELAVLELDELDDELKKSEQQQLVAPDRLPFDHVRDQKTSSERHENDRPSGSVDEVQHLEALDRIENALKGLVSMADELKQVRRAALLIQHFK